MRLWLIGSGIGASPSPAMQNAALRAAGLPGRYEACEVDGAGLAGVLARLRAGEAQGANVTIPHKQAVAAACDELEGDAVATGSVNTVTVESRRLVGGNTDALGFEAAVRAAGLWPGPGATALVLGAGGAAAAVLLALSRAGVSGVAVVARRREAAIALAGRFEGSVPIAAAGWGGDDLRHLLAGASMVVNATPAPLAALPFHPRDLAAGCAVFDLRYRPRPVDLVAAAVEAGHPAGDGLEMVLQQGMLSFRRWTGIEPPWDAARAALIAAVAG
ncbi:MAG: shikimate dehydrogenase [Chloroflexi bacterium]|nr:MAG: shikimate dehydrogenase [Chloroflexota bacterium]